MTKRKIPNVDIIIIFLIGCVGIYLNTWFIDSWKLAFASGMVFFVFYLILFLLRLVSAGDVKLVAVMAFCMGGAAFSQVWCLGVLLQLVYIAAASFLPSLFYAKNKKEGVQPIQNNSSIVRKRSVPYGLIIGISVGIFLLKRHFYD